MRELRRGNTAYTAFILYAFSFCLLSVTAFWPTEDSQWNAELVNISSLCYNASVEDVNPEDPAVWQYARGPLRDYNSFLQNVHSLLGGGHVNGRLSQV